MDDEGACLRVSILDTPSSVPKSEDHAAPLQHQFDVLL